MDPGDLRRDPALREQRRQIHRAVMRGLPVPAELIGQAEDMAYRLRLYSWIGVIYLLLATGWTVSAVLGGSGGSPEWLRWLLAIVAFPLAAWAIYTGYRARRWIRASEKESGANN